MEFFPTTEWIHRGDRKLCGQRRSVTLPIRYAARVHRAALKSHARKPQTCCITVRPTEPAFRSLAHLNIF